MYQCELEDLGKAAILIICISTDFTAGTIQPLVAQVLPADPLYPGMGQP